MRHLALFYERRNSEKISGRCRTKLGEIQILEEAKTRLRHFETTKRYGRVASNYRNPYAAGALIFILLRGHVFRSTPHCSPGNGLAKISLGKRELMSAQSKNLPQRPIAISPNAINHSRSCKCPKRVILVLRPTEIQPTRP